MRNIGQCVEVGYIVGKTEFEANESVTVEGLTGEGHDA